MLLRQGQRDDFSDAIPDLIWPEDPPLFVVEYGSLERYHELAAIEWVQTGAVNSHDVSVLAFEGDQIVGICNGYRAEEMDARYDVTDQILRGIMTDVEMATWDGKMHLIDRAFPRPQDGAFYVLDLSVDPVQQGSGLGRKLLENAAERGRALGCTRLCLDANADLGAVGFYKHFGLAIEVESRVPELDAEHGIGLHYHMSMAL